MTSADIAAASAYWTAAVRARETARPDRLFQDPWASALAGNRGRELLRRKEARDQREDVLLPLRTRWFDDAVAAELTERTGQLVELGAGLDTRPYRLQLPAGTRAFELDQSSVQQHKEAVLATMPTPLRSVTDVTTDLGGDWSRDLVHAGFEPSRRSVWVAEGLLMYLDHGAATRLLRTAASLSAPGSVLILDTLARSARSAARVAGTGAKFLPDDLPSLLATCHWTQREHTTIAGPARAYGRIPDHPRSGEKPADVTYLLVIADLALAEDHDHRR
ncbi:methyltransferase, TIGR00027 family [Microbispora rosea]|uniref:S-adenosyl-L-methionine-dependent methyltransferase n=1 Tax=Microbispora rosea TaxID=58117 RepID=A0A1N7EQI4_9ACTN|nr:SAM-dependent methyltransferase [Microbispora rosea]GIH50576.1 S-adenosyl-L-methionine-dependent methyltransferase [Microbispora rosea subsp. rosea]SIR90351.1 methyltransferase, TIGR00027 family [Microbispora rosea]